MILSVDSEGNDQTAQRGRLIWVFSAHIQVYAPTSFCHGTAHIIYHLS